MVFLLAKLGPVVDGKRRTVWARGTETVDEVAVAVRDIPDDTIVLLEGTSPPWRRAHIANPIPWPDDLGSFDVLVANKSGTVRLDLGDILTVQGTTTRDPRGYPVELAKARERRTILNYAGWRLGDFPKGPIEVVTSKAPRGTVLIVPPRSVPKPLANEPAVRRPQPVAIPKVQPPAAPRAAQPLRFEDRHNFSELKFRDGAVSFLVRGRWVTVEHTKAKELYQEVRNELDEAQAAGVVVRGELLPDGSCTASVEGLDSLDRLFTQIQHACFVRVNLASEQWLEAEDLAERMPGGSGRREPAELISVREFGLARRAEAFRRLFRHRDQSMRVAMLPGRAVIVPIAARDGGQRFHAWETVTNDYATYLFRPRDSATLQLMLDWTRDPELRRRNLLADRELQAALGFVCRVIHNGNDTDLADWWHRICEVTGIQDASGP